MAEFREEQRPFIAAAVDTTFKVINAKDRGFGTGVVISSTGVVLTAWHVVKGSRRAELYRRKLNRTGWRLRTLCEKYRAWVEYADRRLDVAVLRIIDPPPDMVIAGLGDSRELRPGTPLLRIGCDTEQLVQGPCISCSGWDSTSLSAKIRTLAGASGGPLFTFDGDVVGITTAGDLDPKKEPQNFAASIDWIRLLVLYRKKVSALLHR